MSDLSNGSSMETGKRIPPVLFATLQTDRLGRMGRREIYGFTKRKVCRKYPNPTGHTADRPAFPANTLKGQMPSETNTLQTAFSFSNLIVGICRYLFQ